MKSINFLTPKIGSLDPEQAPSEFSRLLGEYFSMSICLVATLAVLGGLFVEQRVRLGKKHSELSGARAAISRDQDQLEKHKASFEAASKSIAEENEKIALLQNKLGLIGARNTRESSLSATLMELNRILPPDVRLLEVRLEDRQLTLRGVTPSQISVSELLALLNRNASFSRDGQMAYLKKLDPESKDAEKPQPESPLFEFKLSTRLPVS